MSVWSAWRQHGVLPAAGGWQDQTRGFTRLCTIADGEAGKLMKQQQERARQRAESQARRNNLASRAR